MFNEASSSNRPGGIGVLEYCGTGVLECSRVKKPEFWSLRCLNDGGRSDAPPATVSAHRMPAHLPSTGYSRICVQGICFAPCPNRPRRRLGIEAVCQDRRRMNRESKRWEFRSYHPYQALGWVSYAICEGLDADTERQFFSTISCIL
jgi:hypothetical protein